MNGIVNHDGNITFDQSTSLGENLFVTADARIDNRRELIQKLNASQTLTDAELILLSYEAWGEECVKHLLGDFAFAIWDARAKRLFCARDHFGIKPFFYAHAGDDFIFNNDLSALRCDDRVSDALNETAIADYLVFGLNQDPVTTTFSDIQRLPAAHTLRLEMNSVTTRRYWTLDIPGPIRFRDEQSYVERFTELLTTAVRDRLQTDRVAVSMSGGLDSTSLAAIASNLLEHKVQGVSNVYDELIPDEERRYSTLAADHIGIPLTHISADRFTLFEQREPFDLHQPEPFLISPLSGQFNELLRTCAQYSRVMLTGYDGDAFMHEPSIAATGDHGGPPLQKLRSFVGVALRGYPSLRFFYEGFKRIQSAKPAPPSLYPEWIDESFAKKTNLRERVQIEPTENDRRPATFAFFNSKVWTPLFDGYHPSSTRLDLDVRHPFMDLRLIEYLLAIPVAPWCVHKHILRVAMKDRLPAAVLNRKKTPLPSDPALQLVRRTSVRWLDSFEVSPQLERFVNLKLRRPVADEETSDGLWASLRVFALNYWLSHSQPVDRRTTENQLNENRAYRTSIA